MIVFSCHWCGKRFERSEEAAGTVVFCTCGTSNVVPLSLTLPEAAPEQQVPPAPSLGPMTWPEQASAATQRDSRFCLNHKQTPATQLCAVCDERFCADCVIQLGERTLCGPCKNFTVRRGQRPPAVSVPAVLAPIIAIFGGPFAILMLAFCAGVQAEQSVVLFFAVAGLVPQLIAFVLAAFALARAENDSKVSGRSLALTGLIAAIVSGVLIGEVATMALHLRG